MANGDERVRVVVPAYQAEASVGPLIAAIRRQGLEVVVVDDGSADGTAAVAARAGAHVISHARNRGKGTALVTGFRWALERHADAVLTLDADGQHDAGDIPRFLEQRGRADLVVGRRALVASSMPPLRLLGNRVSTFFIGLFCGAEPADSQCGFRLYSRRLLDALPLRPGRFEAETEWLMRAQLLGLPVCWVPIRTIYATRQRSHFRNVSDTLRVMRVVLRSPTYPRAPRGTSGGAPNEPR